MRKQNEVPHAMVWAWMQEGGFKGSLHCLDDVGSPDEARRMFERAQQASAGRLFKALETWDFWVSDWFYARSKVALGMLDAGFDPTPWGQEACDSMFARAGKSDDGVWKAQIVKRGLALGWIPSVAKLSGSHPLDVALWDWIERARTGKPQAHSMEEFEALLGASPDYGWDRAARAILEKPTMCQSHLVVERSARQLFEALREREALQMESRGAPNPRKPSSL